MGQVEGSPIQRGRDGGGDAPNDGEGQDVRGLRHGAQNLQSLTSLAVAEPEPDPALSPRSSKAGAELAKMPAQLASKLVSPKSMSSVYLQQAQQIAFTDEDFSLLEAQKDLEKAYKQVPIDAETE